MSVNWVDLLRERGELASTIAGQVTQILAYPDVREDQVDRLYSLVNKHCLAVEEMVRQIEDDDVSDAVLEIAKAVEELWGELAESLANRMTELRGMN